MDQKPEKKSRFDNDNQRLELIKNMNGFTEKDMNNLERIESVELVLEEFPRMNIVSHFKYLKSLTLINVGLTAIEGLEDLVKLEILCLNENQITKISGLNKCVNLKSLFISHNQITSMSGLENSTKLETLWLCDNKIDKLEGLDKLTQLKQLWIAGNSIDALRVSLDKAKSLTDLNIAGNKICSFKEALNLNRLPGLKILAFYDPHFGENPICNLCNYQTYVLYHLRNINKLDTLLISDEAKSFAEATFMKKKMYYNMRIKTMQRTFSTLGKLLRKARKIKKDSLVEDITNLHLKIAETQENLLPKPEMLKELQSYNQDKLEELEHLDAVYESVKRSIFQSCNSTVHKLITELETGGNIRLEEGKSTEKWYVSCVDLIKSRFHAEDMSEYGVSDIDIRRVVRIHNRFLRNKFEEKMESLVDVSNANYKKSLEYLFYGTDPNFPDEIQNVIEEGFRSFHENREVGLCGYTPLVNSILGADSARINLVLKSAKHKEKTGKGFVKRKYLSRFPGDKIQCLGTGVLLICKVLMIKSVPDSQYSYFNPEISWSEMFNKQPVEGSAYLDEYTVFRVKETDPKHKLWFVMDNNLVLPEYLAEFEYVMGSRAQSKFADFGDALALMDADDDEFVSPQNIHSVRDQLSNIYNAHCEDVNNYQFENLDDYPTYELKASDIDRSDISNLKPLLINYFKFCLSRSNYYELNSNLVRDQPVDVPSTVQQADRFLNLSNSSLDNLEQIYFKNTLTTLVLSYNKINAIVGLDKLVKLKRLDLSHNEITTLIGLRQLSQLEQLDVTHNNISSMAQVTVLKQNTNLQDLSILFNPLCEDKYVNEQVIQLLPFLVVFNHKRVVINEKGNMQNKPSKITYEMLHSCCKSTLLSDWKLGVYSVKLTHQKLQSMAGLDGLYQLRQLTLSNNEIKKIESLTDCQLLEELNLEKNRIQKIENLENLVYLKKLELGLNKITKIEGISNLVNLMQLSLEDNLITSLEDFPDLRNLMELYLGNNNVANAKEINNLKNLQKLIILDFSGNPFSREQNYRVYTLFVIRKLKVLDGISIELSEQQMAKDLFTGRLTEEILQSRLYGQSTQKIAELDLSNCKLRDFDDVFSSQHFPMLTELNLSSNLFTSIRMLSYLPYLKILILTQNKIDSLFLTTEFSNKKGLNGCQSLEILDLSNNSIKELHGLQFCVLKELKILKLSRNEITRVEHLENLKSIKELDLNHNRIRQFEPQSFVGQNPVKCLKIESNGLKNFNHIQKLYKLQHLFANSNRINDLPDIEKLTELAYLKELELNGNALSRRPGYRQMVLKKLPSLYYLDGKEVTIEEKERLEIMGGLDRVNILPNIHIAQGGSKVPVKLSSINFEGVFSSVKMEGVIQPNVSKR